MPANNSGREKPVWQFDLVWRPRPLRLLLAWANCALMKNVAETRIVRRLFAASERAVTR